MGRKIKLWKDPNGQGFELYKKHTINIKPGVTVLVGCNGIGKTTLLKNIESELDKENIPCIRFDNLNNGGSNSLSKAVYNDDFTLLSAMMSSSEGENIVINLGKFATRLRRFIESGEDRDKINPLKVVLDDYLNNKTEKVLQKIPDERWILLDAVDSGLSIDNIIDLKEGLFDTILENNFGKEVYIIVSANEYEMANGEQCFDVGAGKYVSLNSYEEYKDLILKSKEWKIEREKG